MRDLGVVQHGADILAEPARPLDLPTERYEAERIADELFAAMERIGQVHHFAKGMGSPPRRSASLAPPQSSIVGVRPRAPIVGGALHWRRAATP